LSRYVVDASVVVKWFIPEVHSGAAIRLLEGGRTLLAPDLLLPEVGNVLWKKIRRRELSEGLARSILENLKSKSLQIIGTPTLVKSALGIATRFDRSFYDSLYLATAVIHDCVLATADDKLYRALRGTMLSPHVQCLSLP
jgi:predicted nucleic acid-binding protein